MLLDLQELKKSYDLKIDGVIHVGAHWGDGFFVKKRAADGNENT